jgi:hypothetical protein
MEESKVNIRKSGGGYLIEITNTPIDQIYAVSEDELRQIVLYGEAILKSQTNYHPLDK